MKILNFLLMLPMRVCATVACAICLPFFEGLKVTKEEIKDIWME